jgi:hypothetical protein
MFTTQLLTSLDIAHLRVAEALSSGVVPTEKVICLSRKFPTYERVTEAQARTAFLECEITLLYVPPSNDFD